MKRITAFLLALVLAISEIPLFITSASATSYKSEAPKNGSYVRIRHAGSSRYLDVPAEGIDACGTQLQVWEYAYGNQNQIFRMYKTDNGWQIISHMSGKCIEVRDSSHNDYAQVAQWDRHDLACAHWDIVNNSDGSVSFCNKESGKYLNVCGGGNAPNGTKIIQYHDDGTSAMRFYIEVMGNADVLSATAVRKIRNSDLSWTKYNSVTSNVINFSGYQKGSGKDSYYPTPGQKIFISAEFLSPNTVATLIQNKSYAKTFKNEIADALAGEMTETSIAALLAEMGFENIPGLGLALGILQTLANSDDAEKWNAFVSTAKFDATGRCSGVIIYTYQTIHRRASWEIDPTKCAYVWKYYITTSTTVEYKDWTGDNFAEVSSLPVQNAVGWSYYKFK